MRGKTRWGTNIPRWKCAQWTHVHESRLFDIIYIRFLSVSCVRYNRNSLCCGSRVAVNLLSNRWIFDDTKGFPDHPHGVWSRSLRFWKQMDDSIRGGGGRCRRRDGGGVHERPGSAGRWLASAWTPLRRSDILRKILKTLRRSVFRPPGAPSGVVGAKPLPVFGWGNPPEGEMKNSHGRHGDRPSPDGGMGCFHRRGGGLSRSLRGDELY